MAGRKYAWLSLLLHTSKLEFLCRVLFGPDPCEEPSQLGMFCCHTSELRRFLLLARNVESNPREVRSTCRLVYATSILGWAQSIGPCKLYNPQLCCWEHFVRWPTPASWKPAIRGTWGYRLSWCMGLAQSSSFCQKFEFLILWTCPTQVTHPGSSSCSQASGFS